jgi:hypothetical protein
MADLTMSNPAAEAAEPETLPPATVALAFQRTGPDEFTLALDGAFQLVIDGAAARWLSRRIEAEIGSAFTRGRPCGARPA